ncbi:MAG: hemerythrin HHE cation-binding protein [Cyanophyceae cyanobacterium]
MATTLDENKMMSIATKLADMKAIQAQMISNEQKLMSAITGDQEISKRMQDMLNDDQESLGTIESAISNVGMQAGADEKTKKFIESIEGLMAGNELSLYEKASQHESLKHQLTMIGLVVHKAAQAAGGDLEKTIDPINKVNFKNRAHQEQLKGILYALGTRELVGKEPDKSIWAGIEDAIAAAKGAFQGLAE